MTKPSLDEVATVLETAADLYESEKINWCQGSWVAGSKNNLSACAEGALLLAAGLTYGEIFGQADEAFAEKPVARAALKALLSTIKQGMDDVSTVYQWNDKRIGNRQSEERLVHVPITGQWVMAVVFGAPDVTVAKAEVVEMMKQAAKDLRNQPATREVSEEVVA